MVLAFPVDASSIGFSKLRVGLPRKSVKLRSPFTGKAQTQGFTYAPWHFEATLVTLDQISSPVAVGNMLAFLIQLQGQSQPFTFYLPNTTIPKSGYTGIVGYVNGNGQTGNSLVTTGWQASKVLLYAGDYFSVNGEFKMAISSVSSDANGNATFSFLPTLRASPASGSAFVISNPLLTLTADDDDVAKWDLSPPFLHDITINATEYF